MNEQYWIDGARECLESEGIQATDEQITRIGQRLAGGAMVEAECTGLTERTAAGKPQKTAEQIRIEKLEDAIQRLADRLGVSVDIDAREIVYYTPVGTSHVGTTRSRL
jgi:hypothetical protein